MNIINQSVTIVTPLTVLDEQMRTCEMAARCCYASKMKEGVQYTPEFLKSLIDKHHESVLEHSCMTVCIITDRQTSHQLVRHRLVAVSQQSERYVRMVPGKHEMCFIQPQGWPNWTDEQKNAFMAHCQAAETSYCRALDEWGLKPEDARVYLNRAVATKMYFSANFREWRHILRERTSPAAQPGIRALALRIHDELCVRYPFLVEDIDICLKGITTLPDVHTRMTQEDPVIDTPSIVSIDGSSAMA